MTNTDPSPRPRVRVALVDRYAMVAETFAVAMRSRCVPIPVVIDDDAPTATLASVILASRPDIALLHLDHAVPDSDLPIEQLTRSGVVTVVLSDHGDPARHRELIGRGAEAALTPRLGLARLVNVIERVSTRQPPSPRDGHRAPIGPVPTASTVTPERHALNHLSAREGEVLRHLMLGRSPAQIARHGYVSEATVRTQVRSICAKLGVTSSLAAVATAYQEGWHPAVSMLVSGQIAG